MLLTDIFAGLAVLSLFVLVLHKRTALLWTIKGMAGL
jgi:hypothetical protein